MEAAYCTSFVSSSVNSSTLTNCALCSGSKEEALQMLKLASEKGIKPWIEVLPSTSALVVS